MIKQITFALIALLLVTTVASASITSPLVKPSQENSFKFFIPITIKHFRGAATQDMTNAIDGGAAGNPLP